MPKASPPPPRPRHTPPHLRPPKPRSHTRPPPTPPHPPPVGSLLHIRQEWCAANLPNCCTGVKATHHPAECDAVGPIIKGNPTNVQERKIWCAYHDGSDGCPTGIPTVNLKASTQRVSSDTKCRQLCKDDDSCVLFGYTQDQKGRGECMLYAKTNLVIGHAGTHTLDDALRNGQTPMWNRL